MTQSNAASTSRAVAIFEPLSRLLAFWKRHGVRATLQRCGVALRRLFFNRMVLFYYDFPRSDASPAKACLPSHLTVERKMKQSEIGCQAWQKILNFWNPILCQRNFSERFQKGASLWLIWCEGNLAGYGWTMTGDTIEPHYHPLGDNDVHLFDFLIFPEFRGRNVNPALVGYILQQMREEGRTRAYIEVREWNQPQLYSLRKTKFQPLGVARKSSLFGRILVEWATGKRPALARSISESDDRVGVTTR